MSYEHTLLRVLNKNKILKSLNEQFGIKKIPGILFQKGKERIFLYQGSLNEREVQEIEKTLPVERVGIYFAKEINGEMRLSIDGIHLLQDQITKNMFELNEEQMLEWMHGSELQIKSGNKGFLIMKYKEDFLGTGKASEEKISNFIPKNRRLRFKEN